MTRREQTDDPSARGMRDVIGFVLLCFALLLFAALFSYDRLDVQVNYVPASEPGPPRNWIGRFGAATADCLFKWCGAAAYLLPVLALSFGLAQFSRTWGYLRHRWLWGAVLMIVCMSALDLYTDKHALDQLARNPKFAGASFLDRVALNISAPSAGGFIGMGLQQFIFGYFGRIGATAILATLWLICCYGLSDFHLGEWFREWWQRRKERRQQATDEKALERQARKLEKERERLQGQLDKLVGKEPSPPSPPAPAPEKPEKPEKKGLGADLQPVPEPTVRDLSVPASQPSKPPPQAEALDATLAEAGLAPSAPVKPAPRPSADEEPFEEPDTVITAREIAAATTADIIGEKRAGLFKPVEQPEQAPDPLEPADQAAPGPGPVVSEEPPSPPPPPPKPKPAPKRSKALAVAAPPTISNYRLPPLDLLSHPEITVKSTESKEDLMANARLIQQTLAQFDIEVSPGDITKGTTITLYELHPAPGVKLERITALTNNMAAALKAERISILAPVPGKSSVGVEVPNAVTSKVMLRELLESDQWRSARARIPLALGKDVYGTPIAADLAEMPHLLIAGSTGSGKSVCINSIIASLLYRFSPDQLRFVMIDPKVVELQHYNALPHLVVPVVTDSKKVILALRWVVNEMEKRYQIFARVGVRNIRSFNERPKNKPLPPREPELPLSSRREKIEAGSDGFAVKVDEQIVVPEEDEIPIPDKLSYIVVIIDELADLMLVAPADVEMAIARITQMARAAGIHCIVATQRPSVDVITGIIKANIPCRIAFQVAAKVDSRTILDAMGADKLLGKGDMLYLPPGSAKLTRAQGALVTDPEIQRVVEFICRQGKPSYEVEIHEQLSKTANGFDEDEGVDEDEDLIQQCIDVIRSEQKASVSLLQRRLRLGYTRAARIMDELENRGIVGPSKGAEPRDILIDLDAAAESENPPPGG